MNDTANAGLERVALVARIQELNESSSQFALYIGKLSGDEKLLNDVAAGDVVKVSRWIPFAYA
ncbi:MAG: hypothetical protein WCP55_14590 [Lentisphaerota bacterium]